MAVPVLNFAAYNPMDTAIQAALGTYKGIGEGRNQQLSAQTAAKKLPYADKEIMAMINLHNAQAQQAQQEANFTKSIYDMINRQRAGQSPVPGQTPGDMPSAMPTGVQGGDVAQPTANISGVGGQGMPATSSPAQGGPIAGYGSENELVGAIIANKLGIDQMSPMRKIEMDIYADALKQRQKAQIEQQFPTTATISDTQNRIKGIEGAWPILEQILALDVPAQTGVNLPGEWGSLKIADVASPNDQAAYLGKLSAAKENALAGLGLKGTEAGLGTIEQIFGRRGLEGGVAYKQRLMDELNALADRYEELGGQKKFKRYDRNSLNDAVRVQSPDGSVKLVPKSKLKSALDKGGRRV